MRKKLSLWIPPVIWASIIFYFSSLPAIKTSEIFWQDFILKKTAHIMEYGIFALLMFRALRGSGRSTKRAGILAIIIASLYGISDEIHQLFTPGRESRIRDVVIDTFGASIFIYGILSFPSRLPKKVKAWVAKLGLI